MGVELLCVGVFVVGSIISLILANRARKCAAERFMNSYKRSHVWGPVQYDGPLEEGGQCVKCGVWATSEQTQPCIASIDEKCLSSAITVLFAFIVWCIASPVVAQPSLADQVAEMERLTDSLKSLPARVDAISAKVDAMSVKVDALAAKVDAVVNVLTPTYGAIKPAGRPVSPPAYLAEPTKADESAKKTCRCSAECTCGCNNGAACTCAAKTAALGPFQLQQSLSQMYQPAQSYQDQTYRQSFQLQQSQSYQQFQPIRNVFRAVGNCGPAGCGR